MPDSLRHFSFARFFPQSAIILTGLIALLAAVFIWGFKYSEPVVQLLPALAVGLCISMLLVPTRQSGTLLITGLALSVPFAHFALVVVGSEGMQWAHLFGALLIVHLVIRMILGDRIPVAPASPWVLAFIAATFISTIAFIELPGEHVTEFWKSEVQFIFGALMFYSVSRLKPKSKHVLWMLKAMMVLSVGVALFGIYQLPARYFGWPGGWIRLSNPSLSGTFQVQALLKDITRSASIFSEPSYFGRFLVGSLALSLGAALHKPGLFGSKPLLSLMIAIQGAALVLSSSMGAWYVLGQLTLVMFFVERKVARRRLVTWLVVLAIIAVTALTGIETISGFPIRSTITDRVTGIAQYFRGDTTQLIEGESLLQRIDTSRIALDVWKDHPVIGVGTGSYTLISYQYGEWNPWGFSANSLVNTLAETGTVGFITLLGIIFTSLYGLWRIFSRGPPPHAPDNPAYEEHELLRLSARMVFYLLVVEALYFHMSGTLFHPEIWFYFGLGAMITVLARKFSKSDKTEQA